MKNFLQILSFLCCFYSFFASAQTDTSRIRVYAPTGNGTYNNQESYKWAIKTDFIQMISSEFPLIGEFRISKRFSTEFSMGITYDLYLLEGEGIFSSGLNKVPNNYSFVRTETSQASTAFRLAFKLYPSKYDSAIEGWFVGVQLMNKNLVRGYLEESNPSLTNETFKRTRTGATIIFGKQVAWDSNVFSEFFFGVGIVRINHSIPAVNNSNDSILRVNNSKITPNILLGYRIGFGN